MLKRRAILLIFGFMLLLFFFQTKAQCPTTKYGIVPVWPQEWTLTDRLNWYQLMSNKGMGYSHTILTWPELEQIRNAGQLNQYIGFIADLKENFNFKFHFLLRNPSLSFNDVPPAYEGLTFADPVLTEALYDFSIQMIDDFAPILDYLTIGGESDIYFNSRPDEVSGFVGLLADIADYVHANHPGIKFSTTLTLYHGILDNDALWQLTRDFSDMLSVTYWPLESDFTVSPTAIADVQTNIIDLIAAAGDKPVIIKEAGLPTDPLTNSSENLQAQFIEELFNQTVHVDQIEIVGWDFLADYDQAAINFWVNFQQIFSPEFEAYIGSLGLMDTLGVPKPGYHTYLDMLDQICATTGIKNAADINFYPNPASDFIVIDAEPGSYVEIYTAEGRKILSDEAGTIEVAHLYPGWYLLVIIDSNGNIQKIEKLLKR